MATYHTDMLASLPLINSSPRKTVWGQGLPVKHSVFIQNWGFKSFKNYSTIRMPELASLFPKFLLLNKASGSLSYRDVWETGPCMSTTLKSLDTLPFKRVYFKTDFIYH